MSRNPLKVKVCGMRDTQNISALVKLKPDYIGLILFPGSKRYVGDEYILEAQIPETIKRTGVFVNAVIPDVFKWINRLKLDLVQLHGNESPEYCKEFFQMKIPVIKAFGVGEDFDFSVLEDYVPWCRYFLFDTKTPLHGGTGKQFDWSILKNYPYETPYFLSGGISTEDPSRINPVNYPKLFAVDVNSRFETEPARKDIELLRQFIKAVHEI